MNFQCRRAANGIWEHDDHCRGGWYHNPDHPLNNHEMHRRGTGLLEVFCLHGVGHPIPESAELMDKILKHKPGTWGIHGCDGCCRKPVV